MRKICCCLFFVISLTILSPKGIFAQLNSGDTLQMLWVDSVYNSLTLEQRIGQLLIVRANQPDQPYDPNISKYIKNFNIGGITFFRQNPLNQALQTNEWQALAQTPLLITMDAEWGVGMRLNNVLKFPYQMTLGAIQNDTLIYDMGLEIARQCIRMGIQMNFAPVIDININPANPVINSRSFGENKYNVSNKGVQYMKGLQDMGIIASAKHFPGHGDTDSDSHLTLPIINHTEERLDSVELYPFKNLIKNGLGGIMIAHLYIPAYESRENTATTLSNAVVNDLLKTKLGFKGLVVTDALDMEGVTKYFKPGIIEQKALEAGNDLLILPQNVPKAIRKLKKAVEKGELPAYIIEKSCKKVLAYKYAAGLSNLNPINQENILEDLNNNDAKYLNRKLYEHALTLIKNTDSILPLKNIDRVKIASVGIGHNNKTAFQDRLDSYSPMTHFYLKKESTIEEQNELLEKLKEFDLVIVGIQNTSIFPANGFGISAATLSFIDTIQLQQNIILDIFANPYSLSYFNDSENIKAILISYQDNSIVYDLSAQLIFGGIGAKGRLPVTASEQYPLSSGITTYPNRLKFTLPEEFGISRNDLQKIDSIILQGINEKAYPGCQVIAVKDGKVFYQKSFGTHTYLTNNPVKNTDLYDIASITKIVSTSLSIMKLSDDGLFDVDHKISELLPYLKNTNKEHIIGRDLLTHQARFKPWIPYYQSTFNKGFIDPTIYQTTISERFPVRVAENLYIQDNYAYHIIDSIIQSPLREENDYKYSDLGFYLLAEIIEDISNQPLEDFVDDNFYKPLGLKNISYLPRNKFPLNRLIPTEEDKDFRRQLIHGDVHDPGAAMLGGVSGHAGLFSNATDIAVIMQMFLQNGNYGGIDFIQKQTINEFTKCQFPLNENRRGLGFDKPLLEYEEGGAVCFSASSDSFGHSGFTGTYTWADPENGLVYVFLSNRIHPNASNSKIMELDIRTNVHEAFYEAIRNAEKEE